MKKYLFLLTSIIFFALLPGCEKDDMPPDRNTPVIEGTVAYQASLPAIGGEADPDGYILTNYRWIQGTPAYTHSRVYISGTINPSLVNHRVRVWGDVKQLSAGGVETPLRHFPDVQVQGLRVIR